MPLRDKNHKITKFTIQILKCTIYTIHDDASSFYRECLI